MFEQTAVFFDWPFGRFTGEVVRFFAPVGHFHPAKVGEQWWVRDDRVANHRGGPDVGVFFATEAEAVVHIGSGT